jgi:hypothetical protein
MTKSIKQSSILVEKLIKASNVTLLMSDNNVSKKDIIKFLVLIDVKRLSYDKFGFPPYRIKMNLWREDNDTKIFYTVQQDSNNYSTYNDWIFLTRDLLKEDLKYYINRICEMTEDIAKSKDLLNKRGIVYQMAYADDNKEKVKLDLSNLFN